MSKFKPYDKSQIMLLPPSVADFVPDGHLAKLVDEIVESLDTRPIEARYHSLGQKSYPPKLLLKLLFYGYCTGTRSGRKIAMKCETDTAYMYLANMYRPDFRTINDFRKDNIDSFECFFKEVLLTCKELGMVKAGLIAIDSTKLSANASIGAFKTIEEYNQWEKQIETQVKEIIKEAEQTDKEEDQNYGDQRGDELPKQLRDLKTLKARIKEAKQRVQGRGKVNFTDTDAKVIRSRKGFGTNYNCQTAVDENGVILAAYASNNASDKEQLIETLEQAEANTEAEYQEVVADAGYASYDNYEAIEKLGKIAYIPDQEYRLKKQDSPYHRSNFSYDKATDTYTCPEGKPLAFEGLYRNKKYKQQSRLYKGTLCHLCSKRPACTKGSKRHIHQELREGLRQKVRNRLATTEGRLKMRQRMHLIESRFGHMKHNLNYNNLMLRGLEKVNAEYKLICTALNILKIHKASILKTIQ